MCGIAGYFSRDGIAPDEGRSLLEAMTRALVHRGPDDSGLFVDPHCGLASTRLSIIDLAGGHMPMFNEDRSVAVVYNGEIYNHASLRSGLLARAIGSRRRATPRSWSTPMKRAAPSFVRR
jgi:asparagine synthase (glutamine-hydrolysing)